MAMALDVSMVRERQSRRRLLSLPEMSRCLGEVTLLKELPHDSLRNCTANNFDVADVYVKEQWKVCEQAHV